VQIKEQVVILVDEHDNPIGESEKLLAHQQGLLHRAFSVFIFRQYEGQQQLLLQRRALHKYHCGGLWTNTCCSHPYPDEDTLVAAKRRLFEEMSLTTPLKAVGAFKYRAEFDNGLCEHEFDHVFVGMAANDVMVIVDPEEVMTYRWMSVDAVQADYQAHPQQYTPWFSSALDLALAARQDNLQRQ